MSEIKANKGTGAGGAKTNLNGIKFEEDIYLKQWIDKAGYEVSGISSSTQRSELYGVYNKQRKLIAYYGRQSKVYDALKELIGNNFSSMYIGQILSKKINPDAFILNSETKTLHIFEKKWQQTSGSVDEKIQTAPFKVEMFSKLLKQFGISVTYNYILSSFFTSASYRNVKEYYRDNYSNIKVWTQGENLDELKIESYL